MAEYLVSMRITIPHDFPADRREELYEKEAVLARRYIMAGKLQRIWRVPGSRANWMLWDVADATELHGLLSAFPLFPMCPQIEVHPLADNGNDPIVVGRAEAAFADRDLDAVYTIPMLQASQFLFPKNTGFRMHDQPGCGLWTLPELLARDWDPAQTFVVERNRVVAV